ncbi:MAG: crossover junction endodeoxyribonuclease RuvC [Planctomycetota bacterium]|jgi:crossover junction endodeoxyribonuclease RuvC
MIILGIDPGSRITGFGLIDNLSNQMKYIGSGNIKVVGDNLPEKLGSIFSQVGAVIEQFRPEQMGIENVFMAKNAASALKLGQARGAAICAGYQAGLQIAEYSPREVKQSIVGSGAASKEQVQHMVKHLLGIRQELKADEADGLAIAICHAQFYATQLKTGIDKSMFKARRNHRR